MLYIQLMGGMGNQMFIYAFARAFQLRYNDEITFVIPEQSLAHAKKCALEELSIPQERISFLRTEPEAWPLKRSDKAPEVFVRARWPYFWVRVYRKLETLCFGSVTEYRPGKDHYEALTQPILNALGVGCLHGAAYAPIRKPPYGKNFFAWGYFQSLRYFEPFQAEIRRELSPRAPLSPAMEAMAEEIKSGQSVSVHIRRGDFFKPGSEIHQVCTAAYYQKAIREISQKIPRAKFYLFSDSPQWIWDNLNLKDVDFHLVEESHTALEDLRLMGCCKHFILSNSSFSWWAQYLAPGEDKIVVAPSRWYRDERETDVYQPDWIRIDP